MAKVTIYLADELEKKARKAAKAGGTSLSRWLAGEVERRLDDAAPPEVLKAAGAFREIPELSELREGYGEDSPRERQ